MVFDFFTSNFYLLLSIWIAIAIITFSYLFFVTAPYGRHASTNWGPSMDARWGWIIMESPSVFLIGGLCIFFRENLTLVSLIFVLIYIFHYFHRTLIWPFIAEMDAKKMPVFVAFLAFVFNIFNVLFQCTWILFIANYENSWLTSFPFILGILIFVTGFYINVRSDYMLINLRKTKGPGYHIPRGFLYEKISAPNYFGEMLEWLGWTISSLSPSGLAFFIWTSANLIPRGISNHKWCNENIENYPQGRKAVIPGII